MSLLRSMLIDNSVTLFCWQLTVLTKLLPLSIVKSPGRLKELISELFVVLSRAICWPRDPQDTSEFNSRNLEVHEELHWQRLGEPLAPFSVRKPNLYLHLRAFLRSY